MVSLQKLKRMERLSFENGLRLYFDSVLLYKNKSYSSACQQSIIAMEELGRAFFIMDMTYYNWRSNLSEKETAEMFNLLYNHPFKQKAFRRWTTDPPITRSARKIWRDTELLEQIKQRATYVGLKKAGRSVDYKGRVYHPCKLDRKQAYNTITDVNSALLEIVLGKLYGSFVLDDNNLDLLINKRLYKKLKLSWKCISMGKKERLSKLERLLNYRR